MNDALKSSPSPSHCVFVLRIISAAALGLAISSASALLALRLGRWLDPNLFHWTFKSAVPLILVGVALTGLQFAVPRTRAQITLGLVAAAAFILWGVEQYLANQAVARCLDDVVVFLFVLDVGIAAWGHLKSGNPSAAPASDQ